eukprot:7363683-Pyramimonas_sp.AAC.1
MCYVVVIPNQSEQYEQYDLCALRRVGYEVSSAARALGPAAISLPYCCHTVSHAGAPPRCRGLPPPRAPR